LPPWSGSSVARGSLRRLQSTGVQCWRAKFRG